jgi:uncharacterized RDD family membrane protein YckC
VYPHSAPSTRQTARAAADVEVLLVMDLSSRPPLAGILVRFAAILLDGILPTLIAIPAAIVISLAGQSLLLSPPTLPGESMQIFIIFVVLLTYLGFMSYSALVLAMWAYGLTPGKWMLGIRVIKRDTGQPASFWRMVLRQTIGQWAAAILCYIGFLLAAIDANRQGWHDKIAKTLVIRTR